jgi:uncharacterized protein (TIGR02996 family)
VRRNAELEAVLAERPDDRDAHRVYADALLAAGDPRGELIATSLAALDEPRRFRKLKNRARKLLAEHIERDLRPRHPVIAERFHAELRDPAEHMPTAGVGGGSLGIEWRFGVARAFVIRGWRILPRERAELVGHAMAFLADPAAAFVTKIIFNDLPIPDLAPLGGLQALRFLDLSDCSEMRDLGALAACSRLADLNLSRTHVTRAMARQLSERIAAAGRRCVVIGVES